MGAIEYKLTRSPSNRKVTRMIPIIRMGIMQGQRHLRILHNDGAMDSIISWQCTATEAAHNRRAMHRDAGSGCKSEHRASFYFKNLCT